MHQNLTHAGRRLLDRRAFCSRAAPAWPASPWRACWHDEQLLASEPPIRPAIDPAQPYAPRPPHFAAQGQERAGDLLLGALSAMSTPSTTSPS